MEANVWPVGDVFNQGGDIQFILPRFQRPYAWEQTEWQALWDDLLDVHGAGAHASHFLGAIVVVNEEIRGTHVPTYTLIDGQQRLLTLSLLLHALLHKVTEQNVITRMRKYLINPDEEDSLRYKVLPTEHYGDRKAWLALVENQQGTGAGNSRLLEAHRFFLKQIEQSTSHRAVAPRELFDTLSTRLKVVFINLKREERPHQIFESLNARGKGLEQADLVRNYLAMRLPANEQDSAYLRHWLPIQDMFEERRSAGISDFLLNYLACKTGTFFREDATYRQFRKRMDSGFTERDSLVTELVTMHRHAEYFHRFLLPDAEPDHSLRLRLERFNALERTVIRPLLLHLYDAHHGGELSHMELLEALDLLDNYLTRHFLANLHTGGLRRFLTSLVKVDSLAELKRRLHTRNYPNDERLRRVLSDLDLYRSGPNRRRLVYILLRVNERLPQGNDVITVLKEAPTVEHIMPRSLNEDWERHLREEWEAPELAQDLYLNSLGNLTLVTQRWNSRMSNSAWEEKSALLRKHGLPLNYLYFGEARPGDVRTWNEQAIRNRGNWIVDALLKLWPDLREGKPREDRYDPERHPRAGYNYKGTGVTDVTLAGRKMNVYGNAWNNAAQLFTNEVAVSRPDFEEIVSDMDSRKLVRDGGYKQLANGWWLRYMDPNEAAGYLMELAGLCELDDRDWGISLKFYD